MFEATYSLWRRLVGREDHSSCQTEDRRLWERYPTNLVTIVQPASAPEPARTTARVRDISLGGVNLAVDRPFESGQLISVELPQGNGEATQSVLACIVRVKEEDPGEWALGCVFSRELAGEDLEGLGARRVRNQPSDKRVWMRFPTSVEASFQKVGDGRNESFSGRILNVSASGVGLQVTERVDTGALLSVDFVGQDKVQRTILACVVHVSPRDDGDWALGCNFIRELSEEDLRTLI